MDIEIALSFIRDCSFLNPLKLVASCVNLLLVFGISFSCISIFFSSNLISTISNVVSKDLESLKTWLEKNKLSLNVANCILKIF